MRYRHHAAALAAIAGVALMPMVAAGQPADAAGSRTSWGDPDLQGIWDYRTLTPLERPEELGDKAFLTEEEAAALERETLERNARLLNRAAETTAASNQVDRREDGTPGFYNNFWLDRGTTAVGTRRTSLIVDPSNGRLPPLTDAARIRAESPEAERIAGVRRGMLPARTYADLDAGDRCIQHAKAGPPISTGGYNNNIHVFQTPDHVVILAEQNYDARIVPLDGQPHVSTQVRQWMGDSRGYWDGDTLVVETVHFNGKHDQIGAAAAELRREPDAGRALHADRRGEPDVRVHGQRSDHLDQPVDRTASDEAEPGADVRVRLSRGQLRDARHHGRLARAGSRGRGRGHGQ